jgi:hypothetical protein
MNKRTGISCYLQSYTVYRRGSVYQVHLPSSGQYDMLALAIAILSAFFSDNLAIIRETQIDGLEVTYGTEYETIDSDGRTSEPLDVAISCARHLAHIECVNF